MKRWIPWLVVAAGCGRTGLPAPAAPSPAEPGQPLAIHWTRTAAEHRAVFLQAYRLAGERVQSLAAGRAAGTWAVILDADETILDNSEYQKERASLGLPWTQESWTAWVRREAADTLPGAAGFMALVRQLGGRVAVVTNRMDYECGDTRDNLAKLGVPVDLLLCRPSSAPSDKNPRFRAVAEGTADPSVPAAEVLLWIGDNIQDFPGLTQAARAGDGSVLAEFGSRFIVLPNPMYGSWERNPPR
jgi:5'-nucleotidase (lipoprotein e(P4) family)